MLRISGLPVLMMESHSCGDSTLSCPDILRTGRSGGGSDTSFTVRVLVTLPGSTGVDGAATATVELGLRRDSALAATFTATGLAAGRLAKGEATGGYSTTVLLTYIILNNKVPKFNSAVNPGNVQ